MKNYSTLLRRLSIGVTAAALIGLSAAQSTLARAAAPMATPHSGSMMMSHGKAVYVCTKCKEYYTPAQAKAMKYTDSMGHHLTMMPKAPAGYMAGSKASAGKMSGGKM